MDTTLRRLMLQATRYDPERFGIELDGEGFTTVHDFVCGFNLTQPISIQASEVLALLESDAYFDKQVGEDAVKFRALTGHRTDHFTYPIRIPEGPLFFATPEGVRHILEADGESGFHSQYVRVYESVEGLKESTSWKRTNKPLVVRIDAVEAHERGVPFYYYCNHWYAEEIPAWSLEVL